MWRRQRGLTPDGVPGYGFLSVDSAGPGPSTTGPGDEACEVIGGLVAEISSHPAPPELRSLADEADRLRTSITAMLGRTPDVLPRAVADRAIETLEDGAAQVGSDPGLLKVVHGDLHYENVLHALPGQPRPVGGHRPSPGGGLPGMGGGPGHPQPVGRRRRDG